MEQMFGAAGVLNTPGVSVCTMATAGMPPPGKADIQPSRAVQQPAHKNTASRNMRSIPEYTHTPTHTRAHKHQGMGQKLTSSLICIACGFFLR